VYNKIHSEQAACTSRPKSFAQVNPVRISNGDTVMSRMLTASSCNRRDINFINGLLPPPPAYCVYVCKPESRIVPLLGYYPNSLLVHTPRQLHFTINLQTPNVNYSGRTAPLNSKVAFYIFIPQIQVLDLLNIVHTLRFFSSKCSLFHNFNIFGSCIIHILYTGCAKIKKKLFRRQKVNITLGVKGEPRWHSG